MRRSVKKRERIEECSLIAKCRMGIIRQPGVRTFPGGFRLQKVTSPIWD